MKAIQARELRKEFGKFCAVDGVSFDLDQGECLGLLGPNGAGKSTLITMVYGASPRTGGDLSVFGQDPSLQSRDIKRAIGVVTQENALDQQMNVIENMHMYARFIGLSHREREARIPELLRFMSLEHKAKAKIRELSGGMQRRLVFVRALLGDPKLVILDEPTTGLDPAVRQNLWQKVESLKQKGVSILLTTHYMDEAERLCDRLVILDRGKVIASGSPKALIRQNCPGFTAAWPREGPFREKAEQLVRWDKRYHIHLNQNDFTIRAGTLDLLEDFRHRLAADPILMRPTNLEDVFLILTGHELHGDA